MLLDRKSDTAGSPVVLGKITMENQIRRHMDRVHLIHFRDFGGSGWAWGEVGDGERLCQIYSHKFTITKIDSETRQWRRLAPTLWPQRQTHKYNHATNTHSHAQRTSHRDMRDAAFPFVPEETNCLRRKSRRNLHPLGSEYPKRRGAIFSTTTDMLLVQPQHKSWDAVRTQEPHLGANSINLRNPTSFQTTLAIVCAFAVTENTAPQQMHNIWCDVVVFSLSLYRSLFWGGFD